MVSSLRRLAVALLTLLAVAALTYSLIDLLPGDPTLAILGEGATQEARAEVRADLGLDDPWPQRFAAWIGSVLSGDLGRSYVTGQPIAEAITQRLPLTLELVLLSQLLAVGTALTLAVALSLPNAERVRPGAVSVAQILVSIPPFVWAVVLIATMAVGAGLFPVTGWTPWSEDPVEHLRSIALPVVALSLGPTALYLRVLLAEIEQTRSEDFVVSARVRGISELRLTAVHLVRPSLGALTALVALSAGATIGGAVIVEEIFALPGMGRLMVDAVGARDYLVIQATVLVIAVAYVLLAAAADIAQATLDPRTRRR